MALSALLLLALPLMVSATGFAVNIQDRLCDASDTLTVDGSGTCAGTTGVGTTKINSIIETIVNLFSVIVGVIAVIMIIWGGLRYITSGGESGKITTAKNTIIYAIIGLIVVALAQFIVKFVLNKVTQ